jgi:23S rRNA U2552 (ribose-2'-O)-methylase RlmE/FtsJ
VIGIDKEYINPIEGAHLLSFSDITDQKTFDKVSRILNESKVHAVVSDMVIKFILLISHFFGTLY